eukprot:Rmarinus@m.19175
MANRTVDVAEPTVIDEELILECAHRSAEGPTQPSDVDAAQEPLEFHEIQCLTFSFKNILKIDNLTGLENLTKLQLDNNILEKIENLDHLVNLTWLDLSFNNIEKIEGLEKLTKLTDLTLFNNRISVLENLDTLTNLQVLSVGNNLITHMDSMLYLRPFKNLRLLNAAGNPISKEADYRAYILAHIPSLKYIDYRLIDETALQAAREQYQDALLQLEEDDQTAEKAAEAEKLRQEKLELFKAANLDGVESLFEDMIREDTELTKFNKMPKMDELMDDYEMHFAKHVDEMKERVLEFHKLKKQEKEEYGKAVEEARRINEEESIRLIEEFENTKKKTLRKLRELLEPREVEERLEELKEANEELSDHLLGLEMVLVEQLQGFTEEFDQKFGALVSQTTEVLQLYFGKVRDREMKWSEDVHNVMTEMFEKVAAATEAGQEVDEELRIYFSEKDMLLTAVATSHDSHESKINNKEESLLNNERSRAENMMKAIDENEYQRNRDRVSEIWSLIDRNRQELEEYQPFDDL